MPSDYEVRMGTVVNPHEIENRSRLNAYSELRELVNSNQVEIIHILSTPRSSSTALERALYQSDDVNLQINDVWANYDTNDREQRTYEQILLEIKGKLILGEKIKVIVKSVADYIPPGESFERMCGLSSHTIVLTRNPLLQMESMMKIMAESVNQDEVIIDGLTMNEYALSLGYEDWQDMRSKVNQKKSYFQYESIYVALFPNEQKIHQSDTMRLAIIHNLEDSIINRIGYENKDSYAISHSFVDWQNFLDEIDTNPDLLNKHQDLLDAIFLCRITGWDAMSQHMSYLDESAHQYTVIDSTMFRALPEQYLKMLAERSGLTYGESIIDWEHHQKDFDPGDDEGVSYYQKLINSSGVYPPVEVPVTMKHFPKFIQDHLSQIGGAFSTYLSLLEAHLTQFDQEQTSDLMKAHVEGKVIQDIDPVFIYALLTVLNSTDLTGFSVNYENYDQEFRLIDKLKGYLNHE